MFTGTLPPRAQKSLALLGKTTCLPKGTYLAGGSGLALHLGHRVSVDFDFFTPNNFNQERVAQKLEQIGSFKIAEIAPDTLLGLFESTKFSLFRYEAILVSKTTSLWGIKIASPQDIGAMKIAAVMDRGTKKDFIDLYFLSKQAGITLDDCLNNYEKKYKKLANNIYSIVKSLTYFDDAEKSEMPPMLKKISWEEIKKFFQAGVKRLAREKLGI